MVEVCFGLEGDSSTVGLRKLERRRRKKNLEREKVYPLLKN
jgi:hypothetical protein